MKFTENGITFPDEGCVLRECDAGAGGSICYCAARMVILELEAAGRCTNCGAIETCACHVNGCPDHETIQLHAFFHICEAQTIDAGTQEQQT
jgi:hypothetical protein